MITQDFFDTNMQYINAVGSMYRQTAVVEHDAATPEEDGGVSTASVDPEDELSDEPEIVEEDEVVE